jgi:nucleoid DNA-binding protein
VKKRDLDRRITLATGETFKRVSFITQTFLEEIVEALVTEGSVDLRGFGRIALRKQKGTPPPGRRYGGKAPTTAPLHRFRICFTKSARLRKEIQLAKKEKRHGQVWRR